MGSTDDQTETRALAELQQRVWDCEPETDDPGFTLDQHTLRRYLIARDWDVDAAEKQLRGTLVWRRETKPQHVVCTYCQKKPGYHAMRQIGFDKQGRPVLYSSFVQCSFETNSPEDSLQHVTYLLENCGRSLQSGAQAFVWIIDFTGMKLTSCNPKIGLAVEKIVSAHYPERLGAFVFLNHGMMFHAFWRAVRGFVCQKTVAKACIHRSLDKVEEELNKTFPNELKQWVMNEIRQNMSQPLPASQRTFWLGNATQHDPRGCATYIRDYIEAFSLDDYRKGTTTNMYLPHPCIIEDALCKTN